ncbi:MAG: membrane protein insertion efficiency factor YidD [Holophagaceae bacterium]|nr:membrane protein insertion efficiency factor YidD [Holophagaceae bacterium]
MKFLLIGAIRIYWLIWPEKKRRTCVYSESCSRYVFRLTNSFGLLTGLRALRQRFRSCRPGYEFCMVNGSMHIRLVDGTVITMSEASECTTSDVLGYCEDIEKHLNTQLPNLSCNPNQSLVSSVML